MAFNRLEFLKRFGLAAGAVALGGPKALGELSAPPAGAAPAGPIAGLGDSLVASGGLCAPLAPFYELRVVDSLPEFRAHRGVSAFARVVD